MSDDAHNVVLSVPTNSTCTPSYTTLLVNKTCYFNYRDVCFDLVIVRLI